MITWHPGRATGGDGRMNAQRILNIHPPISLWTMTSLPDPSDHKQKMFPSRLLRPDERTLVADWLAAAGDVSLAYVSSRKGDGSAIHRRIVIIVEEDEEPSYVINAPKSTNLWIVHPYCPEHEAVPFNSLREALNSIRPVLPDPRKADTGVTPVRIGRQKPSMKVRRSHQ